LSAIGKNERYSRHLILREIGEEGQRKISLSSVLVVGCGGTGTAVCDMLARAGVGSITIIDGDVIDATNLQRQTLFTEKDVGRPKAVAAEGALKAINSDVAVKGVADVLGAANAEKFVESMDLVMDCTDNIRTRLILNDACVKHGKPWIYNGAISTYGMVAAFVPGGACFRCLFPNARETGETCATEGVLNTLPGIIAHIGTTEALKILTGQKPSESLAVYDAWSQDFQKIALKKRKNCECCAKRNFPFLVSPPVRISGICGGFQISPEKPRAVDLAALAQKYGASPPAGGVLVLNVACCQITVFGNGRAIIKGAEDVESAMLLYRKYVEKR